MSEPDPSQIVRGPVTKLIVRRPRRSDLCDFWTNLKRALPIYGILLAFALALATWACWGGADDKPTLPASSLDTVVGPLWVVNDWDCTKAASIVEAKSGTPIQPRWVCSAQPRASEGLSFGKATYFTLAMISTLNAGDISPANGHARVIALIDSFIGVLFIGILIAVLASTFTDADTTGANGDGEAPDRTPGDKPGAGGLAAVPAPEGSLPTSSDTTLTALTEAAFEELTHRGAQHLLDHATHRLRAATQETLWWIHGEREVSAGNDGLDILEKEVLGAFLAWRTALRYLAKITANDRSGKPQSMSDDDARA